jgi:hypothetical protein
MINGCIPLPPPNLRSNPKRTNHSAGRISLLPNAWCIRKGTRPNRLGDQPPRLQPLGNFPRLADPTERPGFPYRSEEILWARRVGDYTLSFGGMILATLGQIWDNFLFDPWGHPMHSVGFIMLMLAILLMTIGFPLWTIANFGSLRGW